nr:hypothetical protein [Tanacetum cinerariifolium]
SMFEISGNNFNDWFRQLKLVLRVERKLFVIKQPISLASPTDSEYLCSGMCKHNTRKTVGELHAMLIEYEKGLPKKAKTPQVMIKGGKIQKSNKNSLKAKAKDDACHHCKEVGHCKRNYPAYLVELIKKKKQVGTASSSDVFIIELFSFPTKSCVYDTSCDNCHYAPSITRGVVSVHRVQQEGLLKSTDDESFDQYVSCLSGCEALVKRDTYVKLQQRSVKCIFIGYPKKTMGYYFYFLPENKIVVARYAEFFEKNLITQEVEGFEPPQEEVIPICRSERTHRALDRLCLNVEVEEYSLGDLNEPASYKSTMLDSESNKWIDAMNTEIQSMIDNMVWVLVDLPPGYKTVGKTFLPVADIRAIRILISIAAFYDYEIWKMDVKTAFLNGYLDGDIYMVQHEGFVDPNHPRKVKAIDWTWSNAYMDKILKRYKTDNSKRGYILMQERHDLNKTQGASTPGEVKRMQNVPYASSVGSIINPEAELRVDCYCNAGFETDIDDLKSQTEYVFILNGKRSRLEKLQVKYYCKACYIS